LFSFATGALVSLLAGVVFDVAVFVITVVVVDVVVVLVHLPIDAFTVSLLSCSIDLSAFILVADD
jgi:hypothetical protein